jgi:outer membrane protein assembly factor BamB
MRKILSLVTVSILVMVMVAGVVSANSENDDWPMFHHDLSLTGYTMYDGPDTSDIAWTLDTEESILSSPAIVDGVLYVGTLAGNLIARDAEDHSPVWTTSIASPIHSSPAVAESQVYFLAENGYLYALNTVDGSQAWSTYVGDGSFDWSSPAVNNGNVFVASSTGNVTSLNATTGAINWRRYIGGQPNSAITVANGKVFAGTHNFDNSAPTLVALNEADGSIVWTYDYYLHHGGTTAFVNCNGAAVADGDGDGQLEVYFGVVTWIGPGPQAICLDEATGNEEWAVNIGGWSTSTPAIHEGVVFIGSDDGNVYALDAAASGAVLWTYSTGASVWAAPAVADGKVYVGSLNHWFYALDEQTGGLVWSYYTGSTSRLVSSPAVADGMAFVCDSSGEIFAFQSDLRITKELIEYSDDDGDGDIEVGEYTEFWLSITVENKDTDDTIFDVMVKDRLGGDLMLVSYDEPAVGAVETYVKGNTEKVFLTWDGFDLGPGETATLDLLVATDVNPGQGKKAVPQNEYTEAGPHELNSGANVKGILHGLQLSATSDSITVDVVEPN